MGLATLGLALYLVVPSIQGGVNGDNNEQQLDMPQVWPGEPGGADRLRRVRIQEIDHETDDDNRPAPDVVRAWRDPDTVAALVDAWRSARPVPDVAVEPGDAGGATPAPVDTPTPTPIALIGSDNGDASIPAYSDVEAAICSAGWPDCQKALRVARCESGDDYYAAAGAYHVGTFQIAYLHAWRFANHGWDISVDGTDVYRNSVVAFEIYQESGWRPWPVCQYR